MNVRALLPSHPVEVDYPGDAAASARRLARALPPLDTFEMPSWRVRGGATEHGVHLWYSLRRRPPRLAPQLFAEWRSADGGHARLVGTIRQEPAVALRVFWTGLVVAVFLLVMAGRGAIPWLAAIVSGAILAGYPWVSWMLASHHVRNIESFVREQAAN